MTGNIGKAGSQSLTQHISGFAPSRSTGRHRSLRGKTCAASGLEANYGMKVYERPNEKLR